MDTSALPPIQFDALADLALMNLYEFYVLGADEYVWLETVGARMPFGGVNALRDVLNELSEKELVKRASSNDGRGRSGWKYGLTKVGAQKVGKFSNEERKRMSDALISSVKEGRQTDEWEPLPLDRIEKSEIDKAISKVEETLARIKASNGYAVKNPGERSLVVGLIQQGVDALKAGWISAKAYRTTLVDPLKQAAKKFGNQLEGELIKSAVAMLTDLLKKLLTAL
jgi:hypothetical protein